MPQNFTALAGYRSPGKLGKAAAMALAGLFNAIAADHPDHESDGMEALQDDPANPGAVLVLWEQEARSVLRPSEVLARLAVMAAQIEEVAAGADEDTEEAPQVCGVALVSLVACQEARAASFKQFLVDHAAAAYPSREESPAWKAHLDRLALVSAVGDAFRRVQAEAA